MIVEYAKIADIAQLTELRLAYLEADHGKLCENDINKIKQGLPDYFRKNLNQNIWGYLIRDNGIIVACAFLLVVEKPNSPAFITGKTGTVLNVYTNPMYRHKGYAKKIINRIMEDAVEKNLSYVELQSTEDGYPLYKSVGFVDEVSKYHSMIWYNE